MNNIDRDEEPSVIKEIRDSVAPLPPPQGIKDSYVPVLPISESAVRWQKIRSLLLVLFIIIALIAVGLITRELLIARDIEETIATVKKDEFLGNVPRIESARTVLSDLVDRHGDRPEVRAAWAWHLVLEAMLFGSEKELRIKAESVLETVEDDVSHAGLAARAGLLFLDGKYQEALNLTIQGLDQYPGEPRLDLVRIRSLAKMPVKGNEKAFKRLDMALEMSPDYIPHIITGIEIAFEAGNRAKTLDLIAKLKKASPKDYLYSSIIVLILSLPEWEDKPPDQKQITFLLKNLVSLKKRIDSAPPKLAILGRFLAGRVALLTGRLKEAHKDLGTVAGHNPSPRFFAWYALATQKLNGSQAMFELLDSRKTVKSSEILDLRIRSLLAYHRVDTAAPFVDELRDTGAFGERLKEFNWVLALRKGDIEAAMAQMPDTIDSAHWRLALELYSQLKTVGNRKGISRLVKAFDDGLRSCAGAIKNWQTTKARALTRLSSDKADACTSVLIGRMFRGHTKPLRLKQAMERAAPTVGSDLYFDVDRAMVTWLTDGHDAATAILDDIWKLQPEGAPIRCVLSRAFLDLEMPKKALRILKGLDNAEALALKYRATRRIEGEDTSILVQKALAKHKKNPHPATAFVSIRSKYFAGEYKEVSRAANGVLPRGGRWTAKIAEMGAKAINLTDDRKDADKLLVKAAGVAGSFSGFDQSLEIKLAQVRLNMRRGGKFVKRAVFWLGELQAMGVKDPRILFGLAMYRIRIKQEKIGVGLLKSALDLDPTFKPAYVQLKKLNKLNKKSTAAMKKALPKFKP